MQGIDRLLVLGGSGAVGAALVAQALAEPRIGTVVAPSRRPLAPRPALDNPVGDLAAGASAGAGWLQADAVACALGTTRRSAGSAAAFVAVDRDLVVDLAAAARRAGARAFALVSARGAGTGAGLYLRTKREAEAAVRALGFPRLVLVRPSLIAATRAQHRPAEAVANTVAAALRSLLPRGLRPVTPDAIAAAMLAALLDGVDGETVIESAALQADARRDA